MTKLIQDLIGPRFNRDDYLLLMVALEQYNNTIAVKEASPLQLARFKQGHSLYTRITKLWENT